MKKIHRLLKRQLKNVDFDSNQLAAMKDFIEAISNTYESFEQDYSHLDHVLEQSSQELFIANKKLKKEMRSMQGKLSKIATNINDVIFEMDSEGRWTYLNSAWEKLTGYTVEESLGKEYHHSLLSEVTEPLRKKITHDNYGSQLYQSSLKYINPEGKPLWFDVSIKSMVNSNNQVEGYIGSLSDITELKRTEEKLINANKAKDQFLSIMSHEIRTPLNAVIGVSNLLLIEEPKESQLDNLNMLKYSSKHLLALVNDILDYNKIISGSLVVEKDHFSIKECLNAQRQIFAPKATSKNLDFVVDIDKNIPSTVIGDTHRLSQILTNLLGNAIKFTESGKVHINVNLKEEINNTYNIEFNIKDTGIGIYKNKLEQIFQPFAQANSNTTRLYGGTGLGLAICKNLVKIMGGELHCISKKGVGSTFTFSLAFGKASPNSTLTSSKNSIISQNKQLKGNVLVVDDNIVNVIILKKFLDRWGINYETAENGLDGFEKSTKKRYDLIFMDIEMPIMNGYQSSIAIRESNKNPNQETPIIALTASTGDKTNKELSRAGMDGLVVKPFDPNELYAMIKGCLEVSNDLGVLPST